MYEVLRDEAGEPIGLLEIDESRVTIIPVEDRGVAYRIDQPQDGT